VCSANHSHNGLGVPTPKGAYWPSPLHEQLFVNVPPMSNHHGHMRPVRGLCHQHQQQRPKDKPSTLTQPATPTMWGLVEMSSLERR
jgi:hypothetical protein